jgi:cytidylate kinase
LDATVIDSLVNAVTQLGFPIIVCGCLAYFIFKIYKDTTDENKAEMARVQERCKLREDKLYDELKANREINAQAIETIARYSAKLDVMESDIKDIKTDVTMILAKEK